MSSQASKFYDNHSALKSSNSYTKILKKMSIEELDNIIKEKKFPNNEDSNQNDVQTPNFNMNSLTFRESNSNFDISPLASRTKSIFKKYNENKYESEETNKSNKALNKSVGNPGHVNLLSNPTNNNNNFALSTNSLNTTDSQVGVGGNINSFLFDLQGKIFELSKQNLELKKDADYFKKCYFESDTGKQFLNQETYINKLKSEYSKNVDLMKNTIENLQQENLKLRNDLCELSNIKDANDKLKSENSLYKKNIEKLKKTKNADYENFSKEITSLRQDNDILKENVDNLNQQIELLKSRLNKYQNNNRNLSKKNLELEKKISELSELTQTRNNKDTDFHFSSSERNALPTNSTKSTTKHASTMLTNRFKEKFPRQMSVSNFNTKISPSKYTNTMMVNARKNKIPAKNNSTFIPQKSRTRSKIGKLTQGEKARKFLYNSGNNLNKESISNSSNNMNFKSDSIQNLMRKTRMNFPTRIKNNSVRLENNNNNNNNSESEVTKDTSLKEQIKKIEKEIPALQSNIQQLIICSENSYADLKNASNQEQEKEILDGLKVIQENIQKKNDKLLEMRKKQKKLLNDLINS